MKKILIVIPMFYVLITLASCSSDDNPLDTSNNDTSMDLIPSEQFIEDVEGGKVFNASFSILSNSQITDLIISQEAHVEDDEFKFFIDENGQLCLTHYEDLATDLSGTNLAETRSDKRGNIEKFNLKKIDDSVFVGHNERFDVRLAVLNTEHPRVELTQKGGGDSTVISYDLKVKIANDYIAFNGISPPVEIYELEGGIAHAQMEYSYASNSLLFFQKLSPGSQPHRISKLNLSSGNVHYIDMNLGSVGDWNLELANGNLYGFQSNGSWVKTDLNLTTYESFTFDNYTSWGFRTAILGDDVYFVGGSESGISVFNTNSDQSPLWVGPMPENRIHAEGITHLDKLYIFGGTNITNSPPTYHDEINIFSLPDAVLNSEQSMNLALGTTRTVTARYQNQIYVGGSAIKTTNNNTTIARPYLGVYNTFNGSFDEIDISTYFPDGNFITSITTNENKLYFLVLSAEGYKVYVSTL